MNTLVKECYGITLEKEKKGSPREESLNKAIWIVLGRNGIKDRAAIVYYKHELRKKVMQKFRREEKKREKEIEELHAPLNFKEYGSSKEFMEEFEEHCRQGNLDICPVD